MPFISSPVAYPPSSSPALVSPRKRKRISQTEGSPLKQQRANAALAQGPALFLEGSDNESESEDSAAERPIGKENLPPVSVDSNNQRTKTATDSLSLGTSIFSQPAKSTTSFNFPQAVSTTHSRWVVKTTKGEQLSLPKRTSRTATSYQHIVAARSEAVAGKARRSYFGIEINSLLEQADAEIEIAKAVCSAAAPVINETTEPSKGRPSLMWTEKYRAKRFTDLVGDDRTHRTVMHWLKAWDQIVFPGSAKRSKKNYLNQSEEKEHRKVLLLTGPPGLGKTTLAHVCARQAGYEVTEINASDERSKDVVKGRIKDMLGTENVRTASDNQKKIAKPICVIVDEVDGVVSGAGGSGEGGFVKALIDLALVDQRNSRKIGQVTQDSTSGPKKKKGDTFRMLRPLIMICNDAYHPSLRLLRTSQLVEIVHCGRPALNNVANRVKAIFEREGVSADGDAVRRLCEGCWGTTSKKEGGTGAGAGDGDIRSILVMGEWVARRIRAAEEAKNTGEPPRLTKKWLETNLADPAANGVMRGLGRGGTREIVDRVFMEGAGLSRSATSTIPQFKSADSSREAFSTVKSVNEAIKGASSAHLRTLIDGHGETDKIMTDLFSQFPSQPIQDDTFLTKPNRAYDWLHFHDQLSSAVFGSSEWELAPYLSSPVLGFHHLFATSSATRARYASDTTSNYSKATATLDQDASPEETHPFATAQASFAAHEREKQHAALLQSLHDSLSLPLTRLFPRPATMAAEFIPYVLRMLAPAVNPVLITSSAGPSKFDNKTTASVRKASERALVDRAVTALLATGLRFARHRVEGPQHSAGAGGFVYRLSLPVDEYGAYPTSDERGFGNDIAGASAPGNRYAVRQVLVQECAVEERKRDEAARKKRRGGDDEEEEVHEEAPEKKKEKSGAKRDFFGRPVLGDDGLEMVVVAAPGERKVWVSFHEGYSNAVRKPITLAELMRGL